MIKILASVVQDTVKFLPDVIISNDPLMKSEDLLVLMQKLAVAILIGGLIGLEREHSRSRDEKSFAGIRTFPLIAILGFISALISSFTSFWVFVALFIGFSSLVTSSHFSTARTGRLGGTSEVSALLVFLLGSMVFWNLIILASIIAVVAVLFLSLKFKLHEFVGKVSEEDIYATVKLATITVIILPLLPDRAFGPLDVLNPRHIWYMVILVSGLSFVGYILIKTLGKDKGIPVTGLMGGLVSSTALTFFLSHKSKDNEKLGENLAVAVILASGVMYLRIFFLTLIIHPSLSMKLLLPMLLFASTAGATGYYMFKKGGNQQRQEVEFKNPFELKSALFFGLIFGVILFVSKAAQHYLGTGGVYAASGIAGFTSVDAIIISLASLTNTVAPKTAAAAIIIASISNNLFKIGITAVYGSKELRKSVSRGLGGVIVLSFVYTVVYLLTK